MKEIIPGKCTVCGSDIENLEEDKLVDFCIENEMYFPFIVCQKCVNLPIEEIDQEILEKIIKSINGKELPSKILLKYGKKEDVQDEIDG